MFLNYFIIIALKLFVDNGEWGCLVMSKSRIFPTITCRQRAWALACKRGPLASCTLAWGECRLGRRGDTLAWEREGEEGEACRGRGRASCRRGGCRACTGRSKTKGQIEKAKINKKKISRTVLIVRYFLIREGQHLLS